MSNENNKYLKLYDYNVLDITPYEDTKKATYNKFKDSKKFIIQAFGINNKGRTISIIIENFNPFFYIKVGDNWNDQIKTGFISELKKKMGSYYEDSIVSAKLIEKHKLHLFDDKKLHNFIIISFTNTNAYNKCKNLFYKTQLINGIYSKKLLKEGYVYSDDEITTNCYLYEANIPPLLKLFHIQEITPSGWVALPESKIKFIKNKKTFCCHEYRISYKDIKPVPEMDDIVKYNICSFDIEASSSHGDFPLAIKDYKKLATNILENYNTNYNNNVNNDYTINLLKREINTAFGFDELNYVDKVYPKLQNISESQINNLIDNFIKYIPANNDGKSKFYVEEESSDSEDEEEPTLKVNQEFIKGTKKN